MNLNDIKSRIERVYASIGQIFSDDVGASLSITHVKNPSGGYIAKVSFNGGQDESERLNKIFTIIHNLANLKDHCKKILSDRGEDDCVIEAEINNAPDLQIVLDLSNADKHGYPTKSNRSGRHPKIERVQSAMRISGDGSSKSGSFIVDPFSGQWATEGNVQIVIHADIVDLDGKNICTLDSLADKTIAQWENIIKQYKLEIS